LEKKGLATRKLRLNKEFAQTHWKSAFTLGKTAQAFNASLHQRELEKRKGEPPHSITWKGVQKRIQAPTIAG